MREGEPQFFKKSEEITSKNEEKENFPSAEIEAEIKFKEELKTQEKAEKEKGEFFDKIQKDEQEMADGILRKLAGAPKGIKKGLMILATAGVILSAGKAFACGDHWQKTQQSWGNIIYHAEQLSSPYDLKERQKLEAMQRQYQLKEKARFEAYRHYQQQVELIQKNYEQKKFYIMMGPPDYFGKQKACEQLEQWRQNELNRLRYEWSLKVWAAEEEYYQKIRQIQQWR